MWWISYRGESGHGVDNIGVFEDDGSPRKKHPLLLDPSPAAQPLHIARGFALVGDDLYIANAWRKDSHIARYHRHGDTFRFEEVLANTKQVAAMVHPFDVELGDDGRIYGSCQDTNTVVSRAEPANHRWRLGHYPNGGFSWHAHGVQPGTLSTVTTRRSMPCASRPQGGRGSAVATALGPRHRRAPEASGVADEAGDSGVVRAPGVAHIVGQELRRPTCSSTARPSSAPRAPASSRWTSRPRRQRRDQGARGDRRARRLGSPSAPTAIFVAERKNHTALLPEGKKKRTFIDDLPDMPGSSSMFPEKSQSGYILSFSLGRCHDGTGLWKTPFALPI